MEYSYDAITILAVAQMLLVVAISFRVIMNRPATGVALAWLVIVALIPNFGAAAYLIIGERRISPRRMARLSEFRVDFRRFTERTIREGLNDVDWSRHPPAARSMDVLGINTAGIPTVTGSSFELIADTQGYSARNCAGHRCGPDQCPDGILYLARGGNSRHRRQCPGPGCRARRTLCGTGRCAGRRPLVAQ